MRLRSSGGPINCFDRLVLHRNPPACLGSNAQGKFVEAESLYKRAVCVGEKALGASHQDIAVWLSKQGEAMLEMVRTGPDISPISCENVRAMSVL